jgi:hypothetical protein
MVRLIVIVAVVSSTPWVARAENRHFEAAKDAYANYRNDEVIPLLDKALAVSTDTGEKTEILELMARMHVAAGKSDDAREVFVQILNLLPTYEVPAGSSPKIRSVFASAKAAMPEPVVEPADDFLAQPKPDETPVVNASSPVWETWWFWTIVGGVVVAGGTALTIALVSPAAPEGDLGGPHLMK